MAPDQTQGGDVSNLGKASYRNAEEIEEESRQEQQAIFPSGDTQSAQPAAEIDPNTIEDHHVFNEEQEQKETERNPWIKAEHFEEDVPIFPGGPLTSEVHSWQKQVDDQGEGHNLFITQVSESYYIIWRTITRMEYKEIVSIPNTDPLQREEMICEQVVLWPQPFTYSVMSKGLGGVPSLIAEQCMAASGFNRDIYYQPLF